MIVDVDTFMSVRAARSSQSNPLIPFHLLDLLTRTVIDLEVVNSRLVLIIRR
jgi:hypothetical protein